MNRLILSVVAVLIVTMGVLSSIPLEKASGANPTLEQVLAIVTDIQSTVNNIETNVVSLPADIATNGAISSAQTVILSAINSAQSGINSLNAKLTETRVNNLDNLDATASSRATQATADEIKTKTDNLPSDPASNTIVNTRASQTTVDSVLASQYIPFKIQAAGLSASCVTPTGQGLTRDADFLRINGGSDFVVTSVIYRYSLEFGSTSDDHVIISALTVDGVQYARPEAKINKALISVGGVDILNLSNLPLTEGFPRVIVANGAGDNDIVIEITCGTLSTNTAGGIRSISAIVSGWKLPSDSITAIYTET